MIRTFFPLDLVSMLFQGRSLSNRAITKDTVVKKEVRFVSLASILGQWFHPQLRKCLWVNTRGLGFCGLASVRNRSSARVWEIDRLLLDEKDNECCHSLLEKLVFAGGESGVEKIFLRLPKDSPLVHTAHKAGFTTYTTEYLYSLDNKKGRTYGDIPYLSMRLKQIGDEYSLFELYQKCIPASIRRVEGVTFKEWQYTKDKNAKREWVFENKGNVIGWLRMEDSHDICHFEVMASGEMDLEQIVVFSLTFLDRYRNLLYVATEFQGDLIRLLQKYGFNEVSSFRVFTKELTVRTQEPFLVPISA